MIIRNYDKYYHSVCQLSLSDHNRLFLTVIPSYFFPIGFVAIHKITWTTSNQQVMPDDYSKLVPHLPIPNRTVKRLCADDSAATSVKVGHRQAFIPHSPWFLRIRGFCFFNSIIFNHHFWHHLIRSNMQFSEQISILKSVHWFRLEISFFLMLICRVNPIELCNDHKTCFSKYSESLQWANMYCRKAQW